MSAEADRLVGGPAGLVFAGGAGVGLGQLQIDGRATWIELEGLGQPKLGGHEIAAGHGPHGDADRGGDVGRVEGQHLGEHPLGAGRTPGAQPDGGRREQGGDIRISPRPS